MAYRLGWDLWIKALLCEPSTSANSWQDNSACSAKILEKTKINTHNTLGHFPWSKVNYFLKKRLTFFVAATLCPGYFCVWYSILVCSILLVSDTLWVRYILCPILFVSDTLCVRYFLCPILFVSDTLCVRYSLCPVHFLSDTFCFRCSLRRHAVCNVHVHMYNCIP